MTAPALDILPGLYKAVGDTGFIVGKLGLYNEAPSIHTRRPVPASAAYPMVVIGPIISRSEEDGINSYRPVIVLDITTYGEQPTQFRDVETIAEAVYGLFHRQRRGFVVPNYSILDVRCGGPSPAPTDDDSRVGRRVRLLIRLYASNR